MCVNFTCAADPSVVVFERITFHVGVQKYFGVFVSDGDGIIVPQI